jgi:SAM-dependent methyltransferase
MREKHLSLLVCTQCARDLVLSGDSVRHGDRVETGTLQCTQCRGTYPVERFIPRFVPVANYTANFGLEWTKHARTQYDSESGLPISEQRFFAETRWRSDLRGDLILEVGSGSGRFTEQAAHTGAMVVSVDYSTAVDANNRSNGARDNVCIVQADLYALPFRKESFDRVLCLGVLQHTPDVEAAFKALVRYLKPGGSLVIDVYRKPAWLKGLLSTKRWVRPLTRRLNPETLYQFVRAYVHVMWPLCRLLGRIPRIGRKLNWALLIADYRGTYALPEEKLREWAVLDTFDMLSPAYDSPQSIETVRGWFRDAGFSEYEVVYGYNGIEARGTKPVLRP